MPDIFQQIFLIRFQAVVVYPFIFTDAVETFKIITVDAFEKNVIKLTWICLKNAIYIAKWHL